jgi:hypothetical protein
MSMPLPIRGAVLGVGRLAEMKRVGLIGCGAIGRPVARALLVGKAGAHSLVPHAISMASR